MTKKKDLGNPALIAAAANVMASKKQSNNQPIVIQAPANTGTNTPSVAPVVVKNGRKFPIVGGIILGGILLVGGGIYIKNRKKAKILSEVDTNPNYRAAQSIFNSIPAGLKKGNGSLFNPFGFIPDLANQIKLLWQKTDTNKILDIAKSQITNYDETLEAFRIVYGEDLSALLSEVLSTQEYNLFFDFSTAYKASQREVEASNNAKIGYFGASTKDTYALSTWYNPKTQAITSKVIRLDKLLPKGTFLGKYVGREVKNIQANDNETYYVFIYGQSKKTGDVIHTYVPKAAVKFQSSTTGLKKITFADYKKGTIKSIG